MGYNWSYFLLTGCQRPVGLSRGKAKVCCYSGWYYCQSCHQDNLFLIPARLLHNWDTSKHKVPAVLKLHPWVNYSAVTSYVQRGFQSIFCRITQSVCLCGSVWVSTKCCTEEGSERLTWQGLHTFWKSVCRLRPPRLLSELCGLTTRLGDNRIEWKEKTLNLLKGKQKKKR